MEPPDCEGGWSLDITNHTPDRLVTLGDGTIVVGGHRETEVVFLGLDTSGVELFEHAAAAADYGVLNSVVPEVRDIAALYEDELVLIAGSGALRAHPASATIPWWYSSILPVTPFFTWASTLQVATSSDGKIVVESWAPDVLLDAIIRLDPEDGTALWQADIINDGLYGTFVTGLAADDGEFGVLVSTYGFAQGVQGSTGMRRYDVEDGAQQPNVYSQWSTLDFEGTNTRCLEILGDGSMLAVVDGPTVLNAQIQRWSPAGVMIGGDDTGSSFGECEIATTDGATAYILSNIGAGGRLWQVSGSTTATLLLPSSPQSRVDVTADHAGGVVVLDAEPGGGSGTVRRYCLD